MPKRMYYVGFRIEIPNKGFNKKVVKSFNALDLPTQIFDFNLDGRITIEKLDGMLIAHGDRSIIPAGMSNFSMMTKISSNKALAERLVKIINVLGNDKLIRERILTFFENKSVINSIPELFPIIEAIAELEKLLPGFIKNGWYYAPEAKFK